VSDRACAACGAELGLLAYMTARGTPLCLNADECLERVRSREEPPEVWVDPYDLPPEDIEVCSTCKGAGQVHTSVWPDSETGARPVADCPTCQTSGKQPVS
jgi:hypothetical protein